MFLGYKEKQNKFDYFKTVFVSASGIFITPGQVLAECGSVGMMFTVWAVCGVVAILGKNVTLVN